MNAVIKRLPTWGQVLSVYGVIALILYTWTLMWFFWKLPSWLYFLNGGEILASLSYLFVTNFAESIAVLCGALFLAIILPKAWFRDVFVARGAALAIAGLGGLLVLAEQFNNFSDYPTLYLPGWIVVLALGCIAAVVYLCGRISLLRRALEAVADRMSIFAYILAPLSIVAVVVVLIRVLL